jgi:hypothetical protein
MEEMTQEITPTAASESTIPLGKAEYFVELRTPHDWSSGPLVLTGNPEGPSRDFQSLAEAAAYAESQHNPTWAKGSVEASYGVRYVTHLDKKPKWVYEQEAREEAQRQAKLSQ